MKKTTSRLLALLLVIAMVCALVPVALATEGVAEINDFKANMKVGEIYACKASVPGSGKSFTWTWKVETGNAVQINAATGVVTAVCKGNSTISATSGDYVAYAEIAVTCCDVPAADCFCPEGCTGTACTCTACKAVKSISVNGVDSSSSMHVVKGKSATITVTATYPTCSGLSAKTDAVPTLSCSDVGYTVVGNTITVASTATGFATVTATYEGKTAKFNVYPSEACNCPTGCTCTNCTSTNCTCPACTKITGIDPQTQFIGKTVGATATIQVKQLTACTHATTYSGLIANNKLTFTPTNSEYFTVNPTTGLVTVVKLPSPIPEGNIEVASVSLNENPSITKKAYVQFNSTARYKLSVTANPTTIGSYSGAYPSSTYSTITARVYDTELQKYATDAKGLSYTFSSSNNNYISVQSSYYTDSYQYGYGTTTAYAGNYAGTATVTATTSYKGQTLTGSTTVTNNGGQQPYGQYDVTASLDGNGRYYFSANTFSQVAYYVGSLSYVTFNSAYNGTMYLNNGGYTGSALSSTTRCYVNGYYNNTPSSYGYVTACYLNDVYYAATNYYNSYNSYSSYNYNTYNNYYNYNNYVKYTAYGMNGQTITGTVYFANNGQTTQQGDVYYDTVTGRSVTLLDSDFQAFFRQSGGTTLNYVTFSINNTTLNNSSSGYLYETANTRTTVQSGRYYYSGYTAAGNYQIGTITYTPGTRTGAYTISVPFTAYGSSSYAGTKSVYGTMTITVNGSSVTTDLTVNAAGQTLDAIGLTNRIRTNSNSYGYNNYNSIWQYYPASSTNTRAYWRNTQTGQISYTDPTYNGYNSTSYYNQYPQATDTYGVYWYSTQYVAGWSYDSSKGCYITRVNPNNSYNTTYTGSSVTDYVCFDSITGGTLYEDSTMKTAVTSNDDFYLNSSTTYKKAAGSVFLKPLTGATTVTIKYSVYRETATGYTTGSYSSYGYSAQGTFQYSGTVTLRVNGATTGFTDVTQAWAKEAISYMSDRGYIAGTSATKFSPNASMTRAQLVLILYRMAGSPSVSGVSNPFTDVSASSTYYNAILWAYNRNVVAGVSGTRFAPDKNLTRQDIATILYRYASASAGTGSLSGFPDASSVSAYALDAMKWAVGKGIIDGVSGKLAPKSTATRAQVTVMLYRYLTK